MKKRIILALTVIAILVFAFAVITSAATVPDESKGTVTLSDKTVCPLYDTNGNALIWYKSTANADDGYANYDFIRADSGNGEEGYEGGTVYFKCTWRGSAATNSSFEESKNAITIYEVSAYKIVDKNGTTIDNNNVIVFNIKDDDVKSNDPESNYLNMPVTGVKWIFNNNDTVEYIYFHPCLAALQENAIVGCQNLKYINFEDLVNLRQMDSANSKCVGANPNLFLGGTCDLSKTSLVKITGGGSMAENAYSKLILPRTLTSAINYPFEKNPNLQEVVFNSTTMTFGGINHFYNCTSLKTVKGFENLTITSINTGFFENCPITSITIPETVETIGTNAFSNTGLTEVVIPNRVTSLGQNAFKNCANLTTVKLGEKVARFGGYDVFNSCPNLTTIYMPAGITGSDLRNTFYGSPNITTVYFVGEESDLNTFCDLLAKVVGNSSFTDIEKISYADYKELKDKTGKYIIYDYSACNAFYNGDHLEETELEYRFSGEKYISTFCSYSGCTRCTDSKETKLVDPLFTSRGYSSSGDAFMYDIKVDHAAIAQYKEFCKATFEKDVEIIYGLVVSSDTTINALIDGEGVVVNNNVLKISFSDDKNVYTNIQIKFNNVISEAEKALQIHACAYVIEDGSVNYIGDGKTTDKSVTVSYNDVSEE